MKKKILLVILSIALCVAIFATTCGAYHTDVTGNGVPLIYYPSIEIISHIGTTPYDPAGEPYIPSQTVSFGSNVFTPNDGVWGEIDTYLSFYQPDLRFNLYSNTYTNPDIAQAPIHDFSIYNESYHEDQLMHSTHSSAFFKTQGFSGKLNPDTMLPEFMPDYSFIAYYDLIKNAETPIENTALRYIVTVPLHTYKEFELASGYKQDKIETKDITFTTYETVGFYDEYDGIRINDSLLDDYYGDFFDDASSINGEYLFFCSGINVRVDAVYADTHELLPLTEKPQLSGTTFLDYTMHHDDNDTIKPLQYSLLSILPPKEQPVLADRTLFDFVTDTIETVMNIEILETKVGDIIGIGVAISVLLILLKVFAGG